MRKRKKRKRKRRQPEPVPGVASAEAYQGPVFTVEGAPGGMSRAAGTFDESNRRPPVRDPLREIDKLIRVKDKSGNA